MYIHMYTHKVQPVCTGRAAVMLFDHLHWNPFLSQWIRPQRNCGGSSSQRGDVTVLQCEGVPWMRRVSQICIAQLIGCVLARELCLDQPIEPSRSDPMHFSYFVLNLARSNDTLRVFCQQARAAKLPFVQTIEAVEGQTLKLKDWQDSYVLTDKAAEGWVSKRPDDLAGLISHLILWRRIRDDGKPGVHVIFEVEANIPEDFIAKLEQCLPTLPTDFDYAYLSHNNLCGKPLYAPGFYWLKPDNTKEGAAASLHCGLITAKGAAKLLNFMWPVTHTNCIEVQMRQNFDKFQAYVYTGDFIHRQTVPPDRLQLNWKRRRLDSSSSIESNRLCWQHLALSPVNNKERQFWDIVACPDLFEGLSDALQMLHDARSVIVVGNGPMSNCLGPQIDSSDAAIIRCNDYASATSPAQHGKRCDLQVINCLSKLSKKSSLPILRWIKDTQVKVIVLDREAPPTTIERLIQDGRKRNLNIGTVSDYASRVVFAPNATRVYLAVALATNAMVSVGGKVELYAFGGTAGHCNDHNKDIGYILEEEWRLWRKLDSQAPWFSWHPNDEEKEYSQPIERWHVQSKDVPLTSWSRTGATRRSKCRPSRSGQANEEEEEEQKLDKSTEKAVQELFAKWGGGDLKAAQPAVAQPAVSSSSFKLLLARPKTKPALVPKPPAVAPPEHLLKQVPKSVWRM